MTNGSKFSALVPCAPINTIDKIVNDPQIKSRNMIIEVEHPVVEKLKMGTATKMSKTPGSVRYPAPLLGQHTNELLTEMFGWDTDTITEKLK